jgi:hypothetical protein
MEIQNLLYIFYEPVTEQIEQDIRSYPTTYEEKPIVSNTMFVTPDIVPNETFPNVGRENHNKHHKSQLFMTIFSSKVFLFFLFS